MWGWYIAFPTGPVCFSNMVRFLWLVRMVLTPEISHPKVSSKRSQNNPFRRNTEPLFGPHQSSSLAFTTPNKPQLCSPGLKLRLVWTQLYFWGMVLLGDPLCYWTENVLTMSIIQEPAIRNVRVACIREWKLVYCPNVSNDSTRHVLFHSNDISTPAELFTAPLTEGLIHRRVLLHLIDLYK